MSHEIEQRARTAAAAAHARRPRRRRAPRSAHHATRDTRPPTPARRGSSFITHHSSFSPASPGFTLIELMIGTVVLAMTLAALGVLTVAVADAWRDAEQPQSTRVAVSRGAARFFEMIRSARYLGWAGRKGDGTGSAVLFWEQDDDDVGRMQLREVALLEFDAGPKTITLYRVPATAPNATMLCDVGDIDEEADVAAFRKSANVVAQVFMHDVVALDVWAHANQEPSDATTTTTIKARPSLEYAVRLASGRDRGWSYETVTLRAPSRPPVKCAGNEWCKCSDSGGCTCASPKSCACSASEPCRSSGNAACCTTTTKSGS